MIRLGAIWRLLAMGALIASGAALGQTPETSLGDSAVAGAEPGIFYGTSTYGTSTIFVVGQPLSELIRQAYHIARPQLIAPGWIAGTRLRLVARLRPGTRQQIPAILQGLLAQYYKLRFHWEKRLLYVYSLQVAPGAAHLTGALDEEGTSASDKRDPGCQPGRPICHNMSSADLAWRLTYLNSNVGPVIDQTGLTGRYTFQLPPPQVSLAEWLKPLGLRIEKQKQEVDVLVVDHCERKSVLELTLDAPPEEEASPEVGSIEPPAESHGISQASVRDAESHANLHVDSTLVTVPVGVLDSKNRPVAGLKKADFTLFDDGVAQTITSLSMEDDPIALCIVYDASTSVGGNSFASWSMLQQVLKQFHPGDEVCQVTVATEARVMIPLTRDESPEDVDGKLFAMRGGGTTALLDGVYLALNEIKKSTRTKKAIVIISDGLDNHSRYSNNEVLNAAREGDALIYAFARTSVTFVAGAPIQDSDDNYVLDSLSAATGGVVYRRGLSIDRAIADLRNRYMLAFAPTDIAKDGRYHRLKVTVRREPKQPRIYVHARSGYYGVKN